MVFGQIPSDHSLALAEIEIPMHPLVRQYQERPLCFGQFCGYLGRIEDVRPKQRK
jgi:hypothetical protein